MWRDLNSRTNPSILKHNYNVMSTFRQPFERCPGRKGIGRLGDGAKGKALADLVRALFWFCRVSAFRRARDGARWGGLSSVL
jgi:hypothetical protein